MFRETTSTTRRRRPTRRFAFLGLLLLTLVAPIGWVAASVPTQAYVVILRDDAVTTVDVDAASGATASFLQLASAHPASALSAAGRDTRGVAHRKVDGNRVAVHVQDITSRNHVGNIEDVYSAAVGGFSARLSSAQSQSIAADPSVAAVIPDEEINIDDATAGLSGSIRTTADPHERIKPGIRRIGARAPTVSALSAGGVQVNADVAILDTGIQRDHPDLNVVGGYNCTGRDRNKWDDDDGHGTHVAGIVGALDNKVGVTGVAPGVRLWSVKVLDGEGHGFVSWLLCGVDWVTAQRDRYSPSQPLIEAANMSLAFRLPGGNDAGCGKTNNDLLHQAICRSVDRGTVYVVAAGNESKNAHQFRPAAYDEVITVSAMADYDGRGGGRGIPSDSCPYWSSEPDDAFTSFSNYGPDIDLIAPGKCILSTYPKSRYAWMSGTSMATPHVTGAAIIYRVKFPHATPEQVRMALVGAGTLDWRTATDPDSDHEKAVWIGQFRTAPDFSVEVSSDLVTIAPNGNTALNVLLARVGGFDDAVSVALDHAPAGITATPVVSRGNGATLTVRVAASTKPGTYMVTVRGVAHDLARTHTITFVVGSGGGTGTGTTQTTFTSPREEFSITSTTTLNVNWTERTSGARVAVRRIDRQVGAIRTAGSCDGVVFRTDASHTNVTALTEHLASGQCYRWMLTLTDSTGSRSTAYSGSVLVDTTAPRAPTVSLTAVADAMHTPDPQALGIGDSFVDAAGVLWVRSGASDDVPIQVNGADAESGIARNSATVTGAGWRTSWASSSPDGALRLFFTSGGGAGHLTVASINSAGLTGPATTLTMMRDAIVPTAATWVSAPSGTTKKVRGSYFKLDWTASTDIGAGVAGQQIVARYVAPLNANGTCITNGFAQDGGFRLASDGSWDSGLQPGSCYVWSIRSIDHVGNTSVSVLSGYVITDRR